MTAEEFKEWVKLMREYGIARSKQKCADLLGKNKNTITQYCKHGCDKATALACKALLHRLDKI